MPTAPQGIDAILAALQSGGVPMGQMGQVPGPFAQPGGITPPMPMPGMPQLPGAPNGAVDPLAGVMGDVNPEMLQMILQALLGGGFNQGQVPIG